MNRAAVFVDAGYLFAGGAKLLCGDKLSRTELKIDHEAVLALLSRLVAELSGLPLLRVYWYDGTSAGPSPQQLSLAYRPNVKLRLGFVNPQGQQKGVDSLVVMDLINLARNRAMADAVLLTGDEDIRVGVQQAQEYGVRVHLVGISPSRENPSGFLVQEADSVRELTLVEVSTFLALADRQTARASPSAAPRLGTPLEAAAQRVARELTAEEREAVLKEAAGGAIPAQVDRRLLLAGSEAMDGSPLTSEQKRRLRAAFVEACRAGWT